VALGVHHSQAEHLDAAALRRLQAPAAQTEKVGATAPCRVIVALTQAIQE
jgi:hypothetical protein